MRKPIIPQELHETIRQERLSGLSNIALCKKYSVSCKAIQKITKGIKIPNSVQNRTILNVNEVYQKYIEIGSLEKLSLFYNKSTTSLKKLFKKNNYKWDSKKSSRIYHFDEEFFRDINTEEKAYWLGFLYADGSIHKGGSGIYIVLQERDRQHLEKLKNALNYSGKIGYVTSTKACNLSVYSQKMQKDLSRQGCMNNKTFKLKFPTEDQVPKHLIRHFIRGYFDGDGCISDTKKQTFSIVGINSFIANIQEIFLGEIDLNKTKLYKHKGADCYSLVQGGRHKIKKIAEYLYKDATIYMERKYNKFKW